MVEFCSSSSNLRGSVEFVFAHDSLLPRSRPDCLQSKTSLSKVQEGENQSLIRTRKVGFFESFVVVSYGAAVM